MLRYQVKIAHIIAGSFDSDAIYRAARAKLHKIRAINSDIVEVDRA